MPRRKINSPQPKVETPETPEEVKPKSGLVLVTVVYDNGTAGEVTYTYELPNPTKATTWVQTIRMNGSTIVGDSGVVTIHPPDRLIRIEIRNA